MCYHMDGPWGRCARRNRPVTRTQTITLAEQSCSERPGGERWLPGAGSASGEGRCLRGALRAGDEVPETRDGGGWRRREHAPCPWTRRWQEAKTESFTCVCFVCVLRCSVRSNSLWPQGLQPARLLCPWGLPGKNTGVGLPFPPPGDFPDPGVEPASPALAGGFSAAVSSGNPMYILPQLEKKNKEGIHNEKKK